MTSRGRPLCAVLAGAAVAAVTACGGSGAPSLAAGTQAASTARGPVAARYWQVIGVVNGQLEQNLAPGRGTFSECLGTSGQPAQTAAYRIRVDLVARDAQLPASQFLAMVEQALTARGWQKFTSDNGSAVSTGGGDQLSLTPGTGSQSDLVTLTLTGPCVSVGPDFVSALPVLNGSMADYYPFAQLSAAPTPTAPLPTP